VGRVQADSLAARGGGVRGLTSRRRAWDDSPAAIPARVLETLAPLLACDRKEKRRGEMKA
jgi:hypothetical protein